MALDFKFVYTFFINQLRGLPQPTADFTGQTIIVTGANVGLGLEAARHFVRLDAAKVILACRSAEKAERAKDDIEASLPGKTGVVEVWPLDLSSFDSVKEFCSKAEKLERLDAVVENAAIAAFEGKAAEGWESTITVNVISTFLMALLLLPTLRRTAARFNVRPRLVIVSSDAHFSAKFKEQTAPNIFDEFKSLNMDGDRYAVSKLLEIFVVRQLAQNTQKDGSNSQAIILNSLNPGFCKTTLFRNIKFPASIVVNLAVSIFGRTSEMGSRNLVYAAAAGEETHGTWIDSCKIREPSAYVRSEEGVRMQERVYEDLMSVLEGIEPGVTKNI